jgi:hypothetical protein
MKRSVALVLGSAVCAVLLSGCGLTSSPAEGLTFTAPSGWQSSPGIMGFAQLWTPSSNSDEVLMLFRSPRQIDREQVFQTGKLKNAKIDSQSKPHNLEVTTSNANGTTYFAMYVYSLNGQPNAQAESALRELCVKH